MHCRVAIEPVAHLLAAAEAGHIVPGASVPVSRKRASSPIRGDFGTQGGVAMGGGSHRFDAGAAAGELYPEQWP